MHKKWRSLLKKSYQEIEFLGLFWELLLQVQQIIWFCVFILDFCVTMFNLCFPFLGNSKPTISLYKKTNILRILVCFLLNTIKDYVKIWSGLQLIHHESQIAICFQKFVVKIVTLLGQLAVSVFPSVNTLLYIKFFIYQILILGITSNNLWKYTKYWRYNKANF